MELRRTLGLWDATLVGLGAIIGAGIFVGIGPAAAKAGDGILLALILAAIPATLNALASAALGATYPKAGGTYYFGRQLLGPVAGFGAGWTFLLAKCASGAVMAKGFGYYLTGAKETPALLAALALVTAVTLIDLRGPKISATVNALLVFLKIGILIVFAVLAFTQPPISSAALTPHPYDLTKIWQGAALLFSVFAGYARIATLAEEVKEPRRTLPRAVFFALGGSLLLYLLVVAGAMRLIGAGGIAVSLAPLADALRQRGLSEFAPLIAAGAIIASASVFLTLIAGTSRVFLAMSREGDLPRPLRHVSANGVPTVAVSFSGVVVAALCFIPDLLTLIGINSACILLYYTVTNVAAMRLKPEERRYPIVFCWLGAIFCLYLIIGLPLNLLIIAAIAVGIGVAGFALKPKSLPPIP